jgi:hypothetical protein
MGTMSNTNERMLGSVDMGECKFQRTSSGNGRRPATGRAGPMREPAPALPLVGYRDHVGASRGASTIHRA